MFKTYLLFALATIDTYLGGYSGQFCNEEHVANATMQIDLKRYSGTWYEIAHIGLVPWEYTCECSKAEYSAVANTTNVSVRNSCLSFGKWHTVDGSAYNPDRLLSGHFSVSFNERFHIEAPYDILLTDYSSYSIVSSCVFGKQSYWILSRTPIINEEMKQTLLEKATNLGANVADTIYQNQTGC
jgi:apolipoprotein D and lipocalin family protein